LPEDGRSANLGLPKSMENKTEGNNKIKFLILVFAVALLWLAGGYFNIPTDGLENFLKKFPVFYSGIIFVILYVIVTFFIWISKDIFRLISAILFGAYISTFFIFIAELINAFILFFLSRSLGRDYVEAKVRNRYRGLEKRLGGVNFLWLVIFRATPLIPFRFMDLAAGLTRISFSKYLAAVVLGTPLRVFWVQFILAGVGRKVFSNPLVIADYLYLNRNVFIFSLVYLTLVVIVAFKINFSRPKA